MEDFGISGLPVAGRLLNHPSPRRIRSVPVASRGHAKFPHIMARILGIEIPNEKRIEASLPYMFGIGRPTVPQVSK